MAFHDLTKEYFEGIMRASETMEAWIYESLTLFEYGSRILMSAKLARLNACFELLTAFVPTNFTKNNLEAINRNIEYLNYYYRDKRDFSLFRKHADELLTKEIPLLKEEVKAFFSQ